MSSQSQATRAGVAREPAAMPIPLAPEAVAAPAPDLATATGRPLAESLRPRGPIELRITSHERPEATLITLAGELDVLTAPKFSAFIDELVRLRGGDVVVDLSEVCFVDSAGLQVLLSARRRISRHANWLAVICPAGPVRQVIELARLSEALGVVSSLDEYEAHRARGGA
jgi:anti-anti-sigma factor